jgi:hypothetical protein
VFRTSRITQAALTAAACAAAATQIVAASPASATTYTYNASDNCGVYPLRCATYGHPDSGLTLYYHSVPSGVLTAPDGSYADFYGNVANYDHDDVTADGFTTRYHYVFHSGAGDGSGQAVKNNAASVRNCGPDNYRIYYNSGYAGHSQLFSSNTNCTLNGYYVNLDSTLKNNNASQHFV